MMVSRRLNCPSRKVWTGGLCMGPQAKPFARGKRGHILFTFTFCLIDESYFFPFFLIRKVFCRRSAGNILLCITIFLYVVVQMTDMISLIHEYMHPKTPGKRCFRLPGEFTIFRTLK